MAKITLFSRNLILGDRVLRHSVVTVLEHWAVAISGLLLLFSGFGQLPMYKRYGVDQIPGLGWSSNFILDLNVHLWVGALFTFVIVFHLVFHRRAGSAAIQPRRGDLKESFRIISAMLKGNPEPPSRKFLAEQRLAYSFLLWMGLVLVVTGVVKMLQAWGVPFPHLFLQGVTLLHLAATMGFLLGFLGHMAAFLIPANRPLFSTMFTRRVPLAYAEHRHPLWVEEMRAAGGGLPQPAVTPADPPAPSRTPEA